MKMQYGTITIIMCEEVGLKKAIESLGILLILYNE